MGEPLGEIEEEEPEWGAPVIISIGGFATAPGLPLRIPCADQRYASMGHGYIIRIPSHVSRMLSEDQNKEKKQQQKISIRAEKFAVVDCGCFCYLSC